MEEHKHILVDARPLVDPKSGGVRRVAMRVLSSLVDTEDPFDFTFVTTGASLKTLPGPFATHPRVTHMHITWPNKLLSLLMMFGLTSIDRLAARERKRRTVPYKQPEDFPQPAARSPQPAFSAALLLNLGFVGFMETPYALVLHDLSFKIDPRWFPLKMRIWHMAVNPREIARRASRIFTVSETTARDAEQLLDVPKEKLEVFHPGITTFGARDSGLGVQDETTHPRTHAPTHPYVLALAASDPRKNATTAIKAVELLRQEPGFENLSLVLTGNDAPRTDWISRMSSISDEELASLYEHASAFLYPSWYEGFGLPLHEAARFGIPCIASSHGALPETAPKGTIFAPPMKPHLWVGMLRDMLSAPDCYRTTFDESLEEADISPIKEWLRTIKQ